jgi:hypothetical protein
MIPDVKNSNVGRQEFIDLLCRITKTDEEMTTTTNTNNEPEITIIEDNSAVEEGEIITLDDDDDDDDDDDEKKEVEDGEITESQESDVCIQFDEIFDVNFDCRRMM